MQGVNQVRKVMECIASCGFVTSLYSGSEDDQVWVGFASYGAHYRYFTVMRADTDQPLIGVIARSESRKLIYKVNAALVDERVALEDLIKDGQTSVLRGLGLYKALLEGGSLKLTDFKPVLCARSMQERYNYWVSSYSVETLQMSESLVCSFDIQGAHEIAERRFAINGNILGVVRNYQGIAVAVYHQGKRIL